MNYDKMTQLALRGVIRDAIRRVIREDGLPGTHHFYITFLTRYPGVEIDETLAEKYPEEVTIVLEHQYWDLKAHDESFEVTLKFGGIPKYLSVPYTAITRFHDPSVGFSMQFDPPEEMSADDVITPPSLAQLNPIKPKPKAVTSKAEKTKPAKKGKDQATAEKIDTTKTENKGDGSTVVSLDSFRKK
ncbi:MAG TPA: hypothetical protein ENJ46_06305 [Hellea balneolensis]|uniref:Stringent starvation protein B n=1 Tax=Hellea balneolensis TaxID=287478 RepID=A0A7C3C9R6_9PROT|nr:hypothetical protein [Hellea balneolensis]